jgi:hypothetical protein
MNNFGINEARLPWNYVVCKTCGKIVRINKPILGSLHFCLSDEDEVLKAWADSAWRQQMYAAKDKHE